ncbi:MAG: tetratricopeptide repeat protein [Silvanigrellaceae bacterium]
MQNPAIGKQSIVLLSVSQDMTKLKQSSESAGFIVIPATSPAECMSLIGNSKPLMFVHNLRNFEPSQINLFHQRLVRHEVAANTKRIVLAPELTVSVLSLVSDCGLRKALQLASALSNLGLRILEIKKEDDNRSASQSFVHNLRMIRSEGVARDFDKAIEEAYSAYPHDLIVKLEYGNYCFRQGKYADARDTALRIVQLEPHNVRAMNLLARAELKMGEKDTALRILDAANKICPHNPDRLTMMGDVLMHQGKQQEAKGKYMAALAVHPTAIDPRESLSQCALSEEEIEQSIKIFSEPLSEDEIASFLNNSGIHALNQNRFEDALKLYKAALIHLKDNNLRSSVYYNLGLANRKNGRNIEAISAFQECLKLNPEHTNAQAHIMEMKTLADAC